MTAVLMPFVVAVVPLPIPTDKSQHIFTSLTLEAVLGHSVMTMPAAASTVAAMGVLKEVYDMTIGGTGFDVMDLVADSVGIELARGL